MDDIKKELQNEIREKKQIGNNAFKRVGKHKKVSMPYEMMSKEERKKYMAPSEVTTYRMGPMTLKEFRDLPADRQNELLKWYGEKYGWTCAAVADALSISSPTAKKLLEEYQLLNMFGARLRRSGEAERRAQNENRRALKTPSKSDKQETNTLTPEENKTTSQEAPEAPTDMYIACLKCQGAQGHVIANYLRGIADSLEPDRKYKVDMSVQLLPGGEQCVSDVEET